MDTEAMTRLEKKIDRLLVLIERFEPLLEKLLVGKGVVPNFIRRTVGNRD